MATEQKTMPIDSLVPFDRNPRHITEKGLAKIETSIKHFGFLNPVIVQRSTMTVVAGHQRLKAAEQAGLTEVPVVLADLSDDEAIAYNIADNKLAQEATWDDDLLNDLLGEMPELDRKLAGFEASELRRRLADAEDQTNTEKIAEVWGVIVECKNEKEQVELLAEFTDRGINCRALMS